MFFQDSHKFPGKLIIVEGIDGSGKSTQVRLLHSFLESKGYPVFMTEWNSSEVIKKTTKEGKKKKSLTPTTFSLLHATDFADRLFYQILPPLKAGMIVLADRYVYTAFARDAVRGAHPAWVRKVYNFAARPDLAFYFKTPLATAIDRILSGRPKLKYYEAGLDLNLASNSEESFKIFQGMILKEYDRIVAEFGLTVVDATLEIEEQQQMVREVVMQQLQGFTTKRRNYAKRNKVFWRRFALPQDKRP
ncbi:MAG: thymidylate kinase [Deltaproteobacteria bacterium]|nr:thymidylate kinase [Deltaproteobacteria bacterium]